MLSIAIISLIGFIGGILYDLSSDHVKLPRARVAGCAVMVISWWEISTPTAIVFLCLATIWLIICIIANSN